jgi:hypothetical protein
MANLEKGAIFGVVTEKIINTKLMEVDARLRNPVEMPYEDLFNLVLEANSLILMVTGDDFEAYEMWKYRLFVNPDGRVYLTQGAEVDTDYVPSDYRELDED